MSKPLFELGVVVATPACLEALSDAGQTLDEFLDRYSQGDWGALCDEDHQANEDALKHGERLFGSYLTKLNIKVWILTEADRSSTCAMLPSDY